MYTFTVRPSNSEKEIFRVKLTATSLLSLKLKIGDIVLLKLPNDGEGPSSRPAIAWDNSGTGMKDTIVQASKILQELYGFKLGDRIGLVKSPEILKDVDTVTVKFLNQTFTERETVSWLGVLSMGVHLKHDVLTPSQKVTVELDGRKEDFEVVDIGGPLLGRITKATQFVISNSSSTSSSHEGVKIQLKADNIGGLRRQFDKIQEEIDFLLDSGVGVRWPGLSRDHGLLLHGSEGTGKSLAIKVMSESGWAGVLKWSPGMQTQPTAKYPQLITVDLKAVTARAEYITNLEGLFEDIKGTPTLIVGEARHLSDVSERLRTVSTFSAKIEFPIPDADQRLEILRLSRRVSQQPDDEQLKDLAARTHGFVGADLELLDRRIRRNAWRRSRHKPRCDDQVDGDTNDTNSSFSSTDTITREDIEAALPTIQPMALRNVFLEKPSVHWDDIGGQHELKRYLNAAVTRPLHPPSRQRMTRLGLTPPKGVLLYGPPGCSKTLTVKALATEASFNFLAVKGAELINMYVGESERAVRDVFRKARAVAPSIIFFDEIDSIAARGGRSGGGSSDLNVLTTLLNEMDGFEELHGVLVVAATNKPQLIDPALLRPGRFDRVVYVGLPDEQTRKEIFQKKLKNVSCGDGVKEGTDGFASRTSGMSGAEVVAVCQLAGELVMDTDRDAIEVADIEEAIRRTPRGVSQKVIEEYERWNEARKSS